MKIEKFEYYEFQLSVSSKEIRYNRIFFIPEIKEMSYFNSMFNQLKSLENIIEKINDVLLGEEECTIEGNNEHFLIISKYFTSFHVTLPDHEIVSVSTLEVLKVFNEYLGWLHKYENCQIPGIIPLNKLDTWVCAPREQVKEVYLAQMDKIQAQKT